MALPGPALCRACRNVNDRPVVSMPNVEYQPSLYFMVAMRPMVGQTHGLENFPDMTQYARPVTVATVDVTLSRQQGLWRFDFSAS